MAKRQRTGQRINTALLRRARLRKGWTLRDVSARCDDLKTPVSFALIAMYERDEVSPTPKNLRAVAIALDLTVDELLDVPEDDVNGSAA